MKTTLKGLQALQIALRNRVERLPDGSVAIQIKNDFTAVTLGDMCAIIEASGSTIRLARELESGYHLYFKTSRNQAKRLRKRLQDWVDSAIGLHQFEQGIQAAAQAGAKAGEDLRTMFAAGSFFKLEIDPSLVARIRDKRVGKTPNSFPPIGHTADSLKAALEKPIEWDGLGDSFTASALAIEEAAKGKQNEILTKHVERLSKALQAANLVKNKALDECRQLQADLEAANLTKDGLFKTTERLKAEIYQDTVDVRFVQNELSKNLQACQKENNTLKTTNAELVRQAQAHNQEAIQLREALANMTRLRDEAMGNSVHLPKEGEEIEYRNTESSPWKTCTVAVRPHGRPYAPDRFGLMYLEAENHGILWRWPEPKPKARAAADAKEGDRVWFVLNGFKVISAIETISGTGIVNIPCPSSPGRRGLFLTRKSYFGKSWGFAD